MTGIQDSTTNHFGSLIRSGGKYIIPKFQRDYSWEAEQWDDLWQDIENMYSEKSDHYMGYLVLQTSNENKDSILVVPISPDYLRSMKIIGQKIELDIILHNKNTLFF